MAIDKWLEARLPSPLVHLDVAACGRVSRQAYDAEAGHLRAEAGGGYLAEQKASPAVQRGRAALAGMVGLGADDVAFGEGAGALFAKLLAAWPLDPGARIGMAASEFGSNARQLRSQAELRGWELVVLPADDLGRVTGVPEGLDLVTFPQVASQRGVVQPVRDVLSSGVPLILDVAQALGQTEVPAGCAAYIGTSRKWLCGPRGVGFAVVDPAWQPKLADPPTLESVEREGMQRFDSGEAHVAGRVGLARAAQEWTPELVPAVHRLAQHARSALDGAGGWRVVEPVEEPSGITTLVGGDPFAARAALIKAGFLTSAVSVNRADELDRPVLRVSTAAWVLPDDLDDLAAALTSVGSAA